MLAPGKHFRYPIEYMSDFTDNKIEDKRESLLSFVFALYRVTNKIPREEALHRKLREEALLAVAKSEYFFRSARDADYQRLSSSIRTLLNYLNIAGRQNWVDGQNFIVLQKALLSFHHSVRNIKVSVPKKEEKKLKPISSIAVKKVVLAKPQRRVKAKSQIKISDRQKKIVQHLNQNGSVQVGDLSSIFPQLSKRTIRRDLESLVKDSLVKRGGKTNGTTYQLL